MLESVRATQGGGSTVVSTSSQPTNTNSIERCQRLLHSQHAKGWGHINFSSNGQTRFVHVCACPHMLTGRKYAMEDASDIAPTFV